MGADAFMKYGKRERDACSVNGEAPPTPQVSVGTQLRLVLPAIQNDIEIDFFFLHPRRKPLYIIY